MAKTRARAAAWAKPRPAATPPRRTRVAALTRPVAKAAAAVAAPPPRASAPAPVEDADAPIGCPPWVWRVALALCVVGLLDATYLTITHYTTAVHLYCSGTGFVDCQAVTTSPESKIFGIPVAVLGLAYFVTMLALQLPAAWRSPAPWLRNLRLAGAVSGTGMVAYLVYTELFTLHQICLYCTGVHVVTLLLFFTVMLGTALLPRPGD